jgi:hypothetical protein
MEKIKASLQKHSQEFTDIIAGNWSQIEAMAASLTAPGVFPKKVMYRDCRCRHPAWWNERGVLRRQDARFRQSPSEGVGKSYYAWLAEGDPRNAGRVKREQSQSDTNTIVTVEQRSPSCGRA